MPGRRSCGQCQSAKSRFRWSGGRRRQATLHLNLGVANRTCRAIERLVSTIRIGPVKKSVQTAARPSAATA